MENSSASTGSSHSAACSLVFPNYGKGGREGPGAKGCPDGIFRSSCNTTSHLLEASSISRTCPGGFLDAKIPFRQCVKVLLEIRPEACETGRGCCCPKRHPTTPNPPQPGEEIETKSHGMVYVGRDNEGSSMAESFVTEV